jgi:hypothetical protein
MYGSLLPENQSPPSRWRKLIVLVLFALLVLVTAAGALVYFLSRPIGRNANGNQNVNTNVHFNPNVLPPDGRIRLTRQEYEANAKQYEREAKASGRTIGHGPDDEWIWIKSHYEILDDPDFQHDFIDIDVDQGVVTVTGVVYAEEERAKAIRIVKNIEGVKAVNDRLKVDTSGPKSYNPINASFDIDRELKKLKDGAAITEVPTAMEVGETRTVVLVLSPSIGAAPAIIEQRKQDVQRHDESNPSRPLGPSTNINSEKAQYSTLMEARLSGQGFEIRAVTPERQPVATNQPTTWTWDVKATGGGEQNLYLSLNAIFEGAGPEKTRAVTTFNKTVQVKVTWRKFFATNWQVIIGGIGIPLTVAIIIPLVKWGAPNLWSSLTKKKKKNGKGIGFK